MASSITVFTSLKPSRWRNALRSEDQADWESIFELAQSILPVFEGLIKNADAGIKDCENAMHELIPIFYGVRMSDWKVILDGVKTANHLQFNRLKDIFREHPKIYSQIKLSGLDHFLDLIKRPRKANAGAAIPKTDLVRSIETAYQVSLTHLYLQIWLAFMGYQSAETYILRFCQKLKNDKDISYWQEIISINNQRRAENSLKIHYYSQTIELSTSIEYKAEAAFKIAEIFCSTYNEKGLMEYKAAEHWYQQALKFGYPNVLSAIANVSRLKYRYCEVWDHENILSYVFEESTSHPVIATATNFRKDAFNSRSIDPTSFYRQDASAKFLSLSKSQLPEDLCEYADFLTLTKNYHEAHALYCRAADGGNTRAKFAAVIEPFQNGWECVSSVRLKTRLNSGRMLMKQLPHKFDTWIEESAENNSPLAETLIADLYAEQCYEAKSCNDINQNLLNALKFNCRSITHHLQGEALDLMLTTPKFILKLIPFIPFIYFENKTSLIDMVNHAEEKYLEMLIHYHQLLKSTVYKPHFFRTRRTEVTLTTKLAYLRDEATFYLCFAAMFLESLPYHFQFQQFTESSRFSEALHRNTDLFITLIANEAIAINPLMLDRLLEKMLFAPHIIQRLFEKLSLQKDPQKFLSYVNYLSPTTNAFHQKLIRILDDSLTKCRGDLICQIAAQTVLSPDVMLLISTYILPFFHPSLSEPTVIEIHSAGYTP